MIKTVEIKRFNKKAASMSRKFSSIVTDFSRLTERELTAGGIEIRNTIIEGLLNPPKTGRMYGDHQASAPGEYPATKSGDLVASIIFDVRNLELEVGSSMDGEKYPEYLELGTPKGQMEPRPFIAPSVEKHAEEILDNIADAFSDIIIQGMR